MSRGGVATRVLGSVRRAVVRLVDDSGPVQRMQVEVHAGEPIPDVDHLQPYGLTGRAPVEARTLLLLVGAAWDHVVALATGHTDRPRNLAPGDVTLYSGHEAAVDLRTDGTTVRGQRLAVAGHVDSAGGFKADGTAGATGPLKTVDGKALLVNGQPVKVKGGLIVADMGG